MRHSDAPTQGLIGLNSSASPLHGKNVVLRPLEPSDLPELRRRELREDIAFTWRHHGVHDSPDIFASRLWSESVFQFVVTIRHSQEIDGLITAYQADPFNGTVYLGAARFSSVGRASFIGALALAFDYLFFGWPIRKIYFESPGFSVRSFHSAIGRCFREEGVLREHVFLDGQYWDLHLLALWRDDWAMLRDRYLRLA